jgi:hypothetical protein
VGEGPAPVWLDGITVLRGQSSHGLADGVGTPVEDLVKTTGLGRLPLAERIGDLVSAGLAAKLPEANQIVGVPAGTALVRLVEAAASQARKDVR